MKRRILYATFAFIFAVLNVLSAIPAVALGSLTTNYETPSGYNENDYRKLVAFLEQGDGMTNGERLNADYDPTDPDTWTGVEWRDGRVARINANLRGLTGELDLSCCAALEELFIAVNDITGLDLSGCVCLRRLYCTQNPRLNELDVSDCAALSELSCSGNPIKLFELSNNPLLSFDSISAEGEGFVGYTKLAYEANGEWQTWDAAEAYAPEGYDFAGWFTEDGALICAIDALNAEDTVFTRVIARFTESDPNATQVPSVPEVTEEPIIPPSIEGDANGDGEVDSTDALIVLRYALGIASLPCAEYISDVNCDGAVDSADALIILRTALGVLN